MPAVFHYRDAISPDVERQADGKYTLKRIPIFECHNREEIRCDERWMEACVADQRAKKKNGFRPRLILGHTGDRPSDPEKPVLAYLDNYAFDPLTRWLYADYVDVPADLFAELKANKWPGRSAEASRTKPSIDVVALLGGTPPYFKLPDVNYHGRGEDIISIYSESLMASPKKLKDAELRKLYADYCKYAGMMDTSAGGGGMAGVAPDAAQEADYQKFCQLMQRYEAEKMPAKEPEVDPKKTPEGAPDDDSPAPYSAPTAKEPNVADTVKYQELLERADKQAADIQRLTDAAEAAEWTVKYSELRIPKGRIDVKEQVSLLMELPAATRQKYFDVSVKQISAPATTPIPEDATAPIAAGSYREAKEIKAYYEANRTKYHGNYGQATRDYRAGARIK